MQICAAPGPEERLQIFSRVAWLDEQDQSGSTGFVGSWRLEISFAGRVAPVVAGALTFGQVNKCASIPATGIRHSIQPFVFPSLYP